MQLCSDIRLKLLVALKYRQNWAPVAKMVSDVPADIDPNYAFDGTPSVRSEHDQDLGMAAKIMTRGRPTTGEEDDDRTFTPRKSARKRELSQESTASRGGRSACKSHAGDDREDQDDMASPPNLFPDRDNLRSSMSASQDVTVTENEDQTAPHKATDSSDVSPEPLSQRLHIRDLAANSPSTDVHSREEGIVTNASAAAEPHIGAITETAPLAKPGEATHVADSQREDEIPQQPRDQEHFILNMLGEGRKTQTPIDENSTGITKLPNQRVAKPGFEMTYVVVHKPVINSYETVEKTEWDAEGLNGKTMEGICEELALSLSRPRIRCIVFRLGVINDDSSVFRVVQRDQQKQFEDMCEKFKEKTKEYVKKGCSIFEIRLTPDSVKASNENEAA